jgi:hypothetical protein
MVTDLGEQPTPEIEPAEPPPGGVDAVEENRFEEPPIVPDLMHLGNERSRDVLPDELTEPEETEDGASLDGAGEPETEEPA